MHKEHQCYCKQAGNKALIPQGVDQYQNILDQTNYILPRIDRYYGFFGKMSRPENRKYLDPDRRNRRASYRYGNYNR